MGLRVPVPDPKSCVPAQPVYASILVPAVAPAGTRTCVPSVPGPDGLCEFDEMDISEVMESFFLECLSLVYLLTNFHH